MQPYWRTRGLQRCFSNFNVHRYHPDSVDLRWDLAFHISNRSLGEAHVVMRLVWRPYFEEQRLPFLRDCGTRSVVPRLPVSPSKRLKMPIIRLHPTSTKSETRGGGRGRRASHLCFNKPFRWSYAHMFENHCSRKYAWDPEPKLLYLSLESSAFPEHFMLSSATAACIPIV